LRCPVANAVVLDPRKRTLPVRSSPACDDPSDAGARPVRAVFRATARDDKLRNSIHWHGAVVLAARRDVWPAAATACDLRRAGRADGCGACRPRQDRLALSGQFLHHPVTARDLVGRGADAGAWYRPDVLLDRRLQRRLEEWFGGAGLRGWRLAD